MLYRKAICKAHVALLCTTESSTANESWNVYRWVGGMHLRLNILPHKHHAAESQPLVRIKQLTVEKGQLTCTTQAPCAENQPLVKLKLLKDTQYSRIHMVILVYLKTGMHWNT